MITPPAKATEMRARLAFTLCLCAGLLPLMSCGDDASFAPGVPAAVALSDSAFTFTALGQNHLFVATATDGAGHPIDVTLTWSTSDPTVVKVNGDGLATATGRGAATVTVSAGSRIAVAAVTIRQTPAHIVAVQGDGQAGPASQALLGPLVIQVTDALNQFVPGVQVSFATSDSGASVTPDTATTDAGGFAATTLTLGPASGFYSVTAGVTGTALTTSFTARTSGPFSIELIFVSNQPTPSQAQAFAVAQQRWETAITADLPDDYATLPANSCGPSPAIDRPIDDLLIFVSLENIDGPGGILGQAAPCFLHSVGLLPAIGQMTFDVADLDVIETQGLLSAVVLHEMGHVLGYGTLWSGLGLLADPSLSGGLDPHFTGPLAIAAFDSLGGAAYAGGKVPVEDQGGPGTADAHWRESVLGNEIMTGYVNLGFNPLSAMSIASMADLGYSVDLSAADPYVVTGPPPAAGTGTVLHLRNDVLRRPIRILDRRAQPAAPRRP